MKLLHLRLIALAVVVGCVGAHTCSITDTCADDTSLLQGITRVRLLKDSVSTSNLLETEGNLLQSQGEWILPTDWSIQASSQWDANYGPDNVKDRGGRPWHSRQTSPSPPQHLTFDAGAVVTLNAFATGHPTGWGGSAMRDYSFLRSNDGVTFEEVTAGTGTNLANGQRQEIEFPAVASRYWRLQMATNYGYHHLLTAQYVEFRSCASSLTADEEEDEDEEEEEEEEEQISKPPQVIHPETNLVQFTPTQADWSTFQSKVDAVSIITGHDPDSIGWIRAQSWEAAQWDGTPYNPSQMSRAELTAAICPSGDTIRGIREVFYQHNPFADNANPTKAEVDNWHRIALNHVRALVGYTAPERQIHPDHCMFARALWGQERKFTRQWDEEYPGRDGSAYGPCRGGGNSHCGATFLPSAEDQEEFLPESHAVCTRRAGSEGIFGASKSNIPWSIKWSRTLCSTLGSEGFWGGHTGPFFHREKFGFSFWDADPPNPQSNAVLRAKWTGNLMPNLYEQR